jgi:outer membrane protein TolC
MNSYRARIIGFLLAIAPLSGHGQQATLTLEECTSLARTNHPMIRQHDLINKSSEYTISNAGKAYLPSLSVTGIGAYIINGFPTVTLPGAAAKEEQKTQAIAILQLNQTIWDGGATKSSKEITRAATETEKAAVDVQLFAIQQRVNEVYFGILLLDEQMKLLDVAEKNLKVNYDRLKLSTENGLGYRVEVDEVESELLKVGQRRTEFQYTRIAFADMLSLLIGKPLAVGATLARPIVSESVLTSTNNRPELIWFTNRTRLVETQSAMNKVSLMPKVSLLAVGVVASPGMQFGTSAISNLSLAGISVSWNTGGLYRNNNQRELDRIQMDRVGVERASFEFNQSLELKQYSADVSRQKAILEADGKIVELKTRIHQSLQLKFDNGLCSASDLILSINNEQDARSNKQLHEIQLLKSLYAYKTSLGN